MDTSTPKVTTTANRRRHTLLQEVIEPSPLRRRSLMINLAKDLEKTNDEHERSNRRNLVDIQRRLSNIPGSSPLNDSTKILGEQDMQAHFQICSKLFAENKINSKNAWKLHIIDLLKDLAQKTTPDTLQVASASLDISTKVYGIRVDDLHADVLKLASMMMAKTVGNPEDEDETHEDELSADKTRTEGQPKQRKKRAIRRSKNTISPDPNSLKAPLPKLESVFFSTRTNADASAIDNLFTNCLKMDSTGCKFMLLSPETAWISESDPVVRDHNKPDRKKYPLIITSFTVKLCAPFRDFYIDKWDPDQEEKQMAAEKSILSQRQEEVVYDENGVPIPELDGSVHDIFEDAGNNDEVEAPNMDDEFQDELIPHCRGEIEHIVDFLPEETNTVQQSEYSYNSVLNSHSGKVVDHIWAGPSHWKLKCIRRSSARYSGQVVEKVVIRQIRKKTDSGPIDFHAARPESEKTPRIKIKKKPPTVDINKLLLPIPDNSCFGFISNLRQLMMRPGFCPVRKKPANENPVDYEVADYQYNNPADSQYCSNGGNDDDNDDDGPANDELVDNDQEIISQGNFLGDNLIEAPEAIPKSYVPYTLQAKKMDMKKLKAGIWQVLTNCVVGTDIMTNRVGVVEPTTFAKMYKALPHLLPEKMRKSLSCPLAFVALLHLCNEQGLTLRQHASLQDFDIFGPTQNK